MGKHTVGPAPRTQWSENSQRAARKLASGPHRSAHESIPSVIPAKAA